MAARAALVAHFKSLLVFGRPLLSYAMTSETVLVFKFFMHFHHLGILAVTDAAAKGIGRSERYYHGKHR